MLDPLSRTIESPQYIDVIFMNFLARRICLYLPSVYCTDLTANSFSVLIFSNRSTHTISILSIRC